MPSKDRMAQTNASSAHANNSSTSPVDKGEVDEEAVLSATASNVSVETETIHPQHPLIILNNYCLRTYGSNCAKCLSGCPQQAIEIDLSKQQAPSVNFGTCNGCGICFGVCDAFGSTRLTNRDLYARIRRIGFPQSQTEHQRVYFTCENNVSSDYTVASNVIVLPCLSMISPNFWTLILSENISIAIACNQTSCAQCERAGALGASLYPRSLEIAAERLDIPYDPSDEDHTDAAQDNRLIIWTAHIPKQATIVNECTDDKTDLGRREMFTGLFHGLDDIATGTRRRKQSSVLKDFYAKQEQLHTDMRMHLNDTSPIDALEPEGHHRTLFFPHNRQLVKACLRRPDRAAAILIELPSIDAKLCAAESSDCKDACTQQCPSGALTLRPTSIDARLCVSCGLCADACPHDAITLQEATGAAYVNATDEIAALLSQDESNAHIASDPSSATDSNSSDAPHPHLSADADANSPSNNHQSHRKRIETT